MTENENARRFQGSGGRADGREAPSVSPDPSREGSRATSLEAGLLAWPGRRAGRRHSGGAAADSHRIPYSPRERRAARRGTSKHVLRYVT